MKIWKLSSLLVATALVVFPAITMAAERSAELWPQWRGPNRDGAIAGDNWPKQLTGGHLTQLWRIELGPGYSGPIVGEDRVFVTETVDARDEVVTALARSDGQAIWRASWPGAMEVPFFAKRTGDWIRATPAYDGQALYVAGMRDVLVSLDAANGNQRWRVDFTQRYGTPLPDFGFSSSPLVVGDDLYVQAGGGLVKLDKHTGDSRWRSLDDGGGMFGSAFSSPIFTRLAGQQQLVVQTRKRLVGVDPADGTVHWSEEIPAFRGMNILTPTVFGDAVLTSAYGGKTNLFAIGTSGDGMRVEPVWTNKLQGYMSTPVVIDGHAYLHLRNRRFACVELASGEIRWTTKPYGDYWSLVAQGDKILALDQTGSLYLIRANPDEFELLDSQTISEEETWGHLAVSGENLYVRELHAIAAYRWR